MQPLAFISVVSQSLLKNKRKTRSKTLKKISPLLCGVYTVEGEWNCVFAFHKNHKLWTKGVVLLSITPLFKILGTQEKNEF